MQQDPWQNLMSPKTDDIWCHPDDWAQTQQRKSASYKLCVGTDTAFPGIYEDAAALAALQIEFGVKKRENIICSVSLCLKIFPHNDTSRLRDN